MSKHKAFRAHSCLERIRRSFDRMKDLAETLSAMQDVFDTVSGEELSTEALAAAADDLPRAVLIRSMAQEGLALVEQISWDVYLFEDDPEGTRSPQLATVQSLKSVLESQKSRFEHIRDAMIAHIEVSLKLLDLAEEYTELLKKVESSG